jgi:serine/threonine-protein kinase RsbW
LPQAQPPATVSLELESRPDSLACVRAMLAGAGQAVGLGGELLDDLRTAVGEACSNVVLHAYGDQLGPLFVDVDLEADGIRVTVADRGAGLNSVAGGQDRMRVGIPLISALADRAEFWSAPGEGTEVCMSFAGRDDGVGPGPWLSGNRAARGLQGDGVGSLLSGDVVAFLSPCSLLAGVLGRVCSAVAVRAQFTLDRHSDLGLVTDVIAAHVVKTVPGGGVGFAVVVLERWLELTVGPLPEGSVSALRSESGSGLEFTAPPHSTLERLVDRLDVEPGEEGEILRVLMWDRRPPVRGPAAGVRERR